MQKTRAQGVEAATEVETETGVEATGTAEAEMEAEKAAEATGTAEAEMEAEKAAEAEAMAMAGTTASSIPYSHSTRNSH
jgi:hypothetical protein